MVICNKNPEQTGAYGHRVKLALLVNKIYRQERFYLTLYGAGWYKLLTLKRLMLFGANENRFPITE
jgi:hypothetical protein